jgi:hypothetical protein
MPGHPRPAKNRFSTNRPFAAAQSPVVVPNQHFCRNQKPAQVGSNPGPNVRLRSFSDHTTHFLSFYTQPKRSPPTRNRAKPVWHKSDVFTGSEKNSRKTHFVVQKHVQKRVFADFSGPYLDKNVFLRPKNRFFGFPVKFCVDIALLVLGEKSSRKSTIFMAPMRDLHLKTPKACDFFPGQKSGFFENFLIFGKFL